MSDDPMTTATAEMFLRQRDEYAEAWRSRGRELNEIYDALTAAVEESAPGFDPVADLKALGAQRDRLRAENTRLRDALSEYGDHQSWRCEHRAHNFYIVGRDATADPDCPCGLDAELRALGLLDASPSRRIQAST